MTPTERVQLTHDEFKRLPHAKRVKATKEGRADNILGATTPPRLADFPDDHEITMDEYRSMVIGDRYEALQTGRMDHIRKPARNIQ